MTHGGTTTQASGPVPGIGPRLSIMMFLQFFVWGSWYVSMTGFINSANMSGVTSAAYSVGPIAAIVSPFFLGMIADRFFATERVLAAMHILGGICLFIAPNVASAFPEGGNAFTHPFILLLLAHMLCYMPTLGLTNTLAFHNMTDQEKQFPLIRVFGTIGWIVGNIAVSFLPGKDASSAQFMLAGGAAIALGIYSLTLPHTPPPSKGKKAEMKDILGLDSLALFKSPAYAVFILCSFLICIPLAGYYNEARNFVEASGALVNNSATFTMSFGQMSEIFFMLVMPLFFARLGVKYMLLVGMLAWVARYGLFAAAASDRVMWMILGGVVLHGICYDFFFVTGQIYVDKKAPAAIRGQAQGFLVFITQGLGMFLGAQIFGQIVANNTVDKVKHWQQIWMVPCIAAAVIAVVFFALFREDKSVESKESGTLDAPLELGPVQ